jgi:hypothetical protein
MTERETKSCNTSYRANPTTGYPKNKSYFLINIAAVINPALAIRTKPVYYA